MGMLEHLLRSLNSDIVNTIFLFSMLIIFALGIGLGKVRISHMAREHLLVTH